MILVYIIGWILFGVVDSVSGNHNTLIRYANNDIYILCEASNASMCAYFCLKIDPPEKVIFFPQEKLHCQHSSLIEYSSRGMDHTNSTVNDADHYIVINGTSVLFYWNRNGYVISLAYSPAAYHLSAFNLQAKLEGMESRLQKVKDIRTTPVGIIPNAVHYAKKGASYVKETSASIIPQGKATEMVSSVAGRLQSFIPQRFYMSNVNNSEDGELEFLLMDLLDDYTIRQWGRYQFEPEKVFVWKEVYEAWLEIDEIVKILAKKLKEGDESRILKFEMRVGTRNRTLRQKEVDVIKKGDFEIAPFIFKQVSVKGKTENEKPKDIIFIVANTPSAISFANMFTACSTVCNKYYLTVTSNLIFCCDREDVKNSKLERNGRVLAMPRKTTGFPPIVLRLSAKGELEFVWDQPDVPESTLVNHNFCAHKLKPTAEAMVIETDEVSSGPCELQAKISEKPIAKDVFQYGVIVNVPKTNIELSQLTKLLERYKISFLFGKLSGGFKKSEAYHEESETCVLTDKVPIPKRLIPWRRHNVPVESSSQAITCLVAKRKDNKKKEELPAAEEKVEDFALFLKLYVHFVDKNDRKVYQYTLNSGSARRAASLSEEQLEDDSFDWIYDCGGEEINYEKTFSKATVNSSLRAMSLEHHINTVWSKGYLKPVRLVPTYDLMFEGFEGVSNRCAVTPIWSSLHKTWIKLENTIRKISVKLNTNVEVFVGVHKALSFEVNGKTKFFRLLWFKSRALTDITTTTDVNETKNSASVTNETGTTDRPEKPDHITVNTIGKEISAVPDVKDDAVSATAVPVEVVPNDTLLAIANREKSSDSISIVDSEVDINEMLASVEKDMPGGPTKEAAESVVETGGSSGGSSVLPKKKGPIKTFEVPGTILKAIHTDKGSLLFVFVNDIFGTGTGAMFEKRCPKSCSEYGLVELAGKDEESVIFCCPVSVLKELEYTSTIGKMEKWEQELKLEEEGVPSEVKTDSKEVVVEIL